MLSAIAPADGARHIVFFDGVCTMCSRNVKLLIRLDYKRVLHFATLQGTTAESLRQAGVLDLVPVQADPDSAETFRTVVFLANEGSPSCRIFQRSEAVLQILAHVGGISKVLSWSRVLPKILLDSAYDFVSSRRYRWFGKREELVCELPSIDDASRFLP